MKVSKIEQEKELKSFINLVGSRIVSCFPYAVQQLIYNKLVNIRRKRISSSTDSEISVLMNLDLPSEEYKEALMFAARENFYISPSKYLFKENHKISLKYQVYRKKYYALCLAFAHAYGGSKEAFYEKESLLRLIAQHLFKKTLANWGPKEYYLESTKEFKNIASLSKNFIPKDIFNSSTASSCRGEKKFFESLNLSKIQKEKLLEECKFQIKNLDCYHSPVSNYYHWQNLSCSMHQVIKEGASELIILCEESLNEGNND